VGNVGLSESLSELFDPIYPGQDAPTEPDMF
jgi:hypothetical protein